MAFWGVEVKPGKPYTHVRDVDKGKLRLTQATLGNGTSAKRVIVQCNVGNKSPVLLCALLPEKTESLSLNLEFEEEEDVVLSVIGPRSIHLCGYFLGPCGRGGGDETDSYGEDIMESESDYRNSDSEDEYEEDFIDDGDLEMFPPSPKPNSGVVIEEIAGEEEPPKGTDLRRLRKQQVIVSDDDVDGGSEHQISLRQVRTQLSESEDDDGFPISLSLKNKSDGKSTEENYLSEGKDTVAMEAGFQRVTKQSSEKVDRKSKKRNKEQLKTEKGPDADCILSEKGIGDEEVKVHQAQDEQLRKDGEPGESKKGGKIGKNKKRKKKSGEKVTSTPVLPGEKAISNESEDQSLDKHGGEKTIKDKEDATVNSSMVPEETGNSNKKNKKKRTKSELSQDGQKTDRENDQNEGDRNHKTSKSEKKRKKSKSVAHAKIDGKIVEEVKGQVGEVKPYQTRSFSNGLIIEELAMGKPDGQRACSGKKVLVNYIGKLLNGKIVDSNICQRPFQFRLGVGEVVKGWDVGVNGMRIGDKRRLTIPPSMGYGSKNVGKIPANSTLVFDVELVAVK